MSSKWLKEMLLSLPPQRATFSPSCREKTCQCCWPLQHGRREWGHTPPSPGSSLSLRSMRLVWSSSMSARPVVWIGRHPLKCRSRAQRARRTVGGWMRSLKMCSWRKASTSTCPTASRWREPLVWSARSPYSSGKVRTRVCSPNLCILYHVWQCLSSFVFFNRSDAVLTPEISFSSLLMQNSNQWLISQHIVVLLIGFVQTSIVFTHTQKMFCHCVDEFLTHQSRLYLCPSELQTLYSPSYCSAALESFFRSVWKSKVSQTQSFSVRGLQLKIKPNMFSEYF